MADPVFGPESTSIRVRGEEDLVACGADPVLRGVYAYWRGVHPPVGLPGRQHIDPQALRKFLPYIWLIDIEREPFRLRYRLIGTAVVHVLGKDMTGQWFDEAHPEPASRTSYLARAQGVMSDGVPDWRRGRPNLWQHETHHIVQNLILPLAADGTTVDMLFNASVFSTGTV